MKNLHLKKLTAMFLAAATIFSGIPANVNAAQTEEAVREQAADTEQTVDMSIPVEQRYFPDEVFRTYILEAVDTDGDGTLSRAEIAGVVSMDVSGKGIASLKGIEVFKELEELDCSNNHLAELDVTELMKLKTLVCENNRVAVAADANNGFTLPFTAADYVGRVKNLTGASQKGNVFIAAAESVSYSFDAGNTFSITVFVQVNKFRKDISKATVQAIPGADYTGNAIEPKITLIFQGKPVSASDYTVTYRNNVNAGTASIVITGINNFTGTKTAVFTIRSKNISGLSFSKIPDKVYTGKAIKPSVTVKDRGRALKAGLDYTAVYRNNKQTGKASITIRGKGNYKGTKTISFKIVPKKVSSFKKGKVTSTSVTLKWKKTASITGYQIFQYNPKTKKYHQIKKAGAKTTSVTIKKLTPYTTYRFKIRAYKKSGKTMYYGKDSKVLKVQTKLSTPAIEVSSNRKGQAVVSWNKVSKASGLELSYREGSGKYKVLSNNLENKANRVYLCELTEGASYTFRMRAYRTKNGKKVYSDYAVKTVVISSQGSVLSGGDYSPGSVYGPSLNAAELSQVQEKVQYFKDHYIDDGMSDYLKVKLAHDYLATVCSYAPDWSLNRANTAWGALVYGEAQCSGYARAMKALCDGIGIGCYYVHADSNSLNPSHQWNEVCIDGNWYIIDVQANDSSGFYAFFLVSDNTYAGMSGMSWDRSSVPACPRDYF